MDMYIHLISDVYQSLDWAITDGYLDCFLDFIQSRIEINKHAAIAKYMLSIL